MITVTFETFMLLFVMAGLALVFGLWVYYDRRDRSLFDAQRFRHTFHCVKCGTLYESRGHQSLADCPHCGFKNERLRF